MHKQVILGSDNNSIRTWYRALNRWNETRKLRDAVRKHADLVSSLDAHVLYDIGESDYRRSHSRSALWEQNPYQLLINTIVNRGS
jgi:hypothetical protein